MLGHPSIKNWPELEVRPVRGGATCRVCVGMGPSIGQCGDLPDHRARRLHTPGLEAQPPDAAAAFPHTPFRFAHRPACRSFCAICIWPQPSASASALHLIPKHAGAAALGREHRQRAREAARVVSGVCGGGRAVQFSPKTNRCQPRTRDGVFVGALATGRDCGDWAGWLVAWGLGSSALRALLHRYQQHIATLPPPPTPPPPPTQPPHIHTPHTPPPLPTSPMPLSPTRSQERHGAAHGGAGGHEGRGAVLGAGARAAGGGPVGHGRTCAPRCYRRWFAVRQGLVRQDSHSTSCPSQQAYRHSVSCRQAPMIAAADRVAWGYRGRLHAPAPLDYCLLGPISLGSGT